jgi:hypothetical protein
MKITLVDKETQNNGLFKIGYKQCITDLKFILEQAKIFDPKMDVISLLNDWDKIVSQLPEASQ